MSDFYIRPASLDDLAQLNALMFELHDYHHRSMPLDIKEAAEIEKEKSIALYINDPECLVYVAIEPQTEQVAGFITGHFCELVSVVSKSIQMGSVDELFVSEKYRNNSIADSLMKRLALTFEEYGVKKIFVEVWQFNESAIHFYQKSGFEHHIHWLCKTIR